MNYVSCYRVGAVFRYARDDRLHDASYRALKPPATKKKRLRGLSSAGSPRFVVLPLLMSYGIMPLTYSKFSPYFFINVLYSYGAFGTRQRFARAHACHLAREAEAKEANRNATET